MKKKKDEKIQTDANNYTQSHGHGTTPMPTTFSIVHESSPLVARSYDAALVKLTMGLSFHNEAPQRHKEYLGLFSLILSSMFFTAMAMCVKICWQGRFGSFEIVFARSIVQLLLSLSACLVLRINPLGRPGIRRWLVLRGLFMALGLSLFFYSLTSIPLLEATGLFFLGPVFTFVIGAVVLEDRLTGWDALYTLGSIVGVTLITQPNLWSRFSFISTSVRLGHACALGGAVMAAFSFLTVRKIGKGTHFLVHSAYFGVLSMLISPPGWFVFQRWVFPSPDTNDLPFISLVLVGLFAFIGQCFLHLGLKWTPTGLGLGSHVTDMVFALIGGWFGFHELPDGHVAYGAVLIALSTTAFGLHQLQLRAIHLARYQATRKKQSRERLYSE